MSQMQHGVLGAGGVGGFLAGALGRPVGGGAAPASGVARRYDGRLVVESALLGDFEVNVPAAATLARPVDVLWVTPKATRSWRRRSS